jgi:hypothetical protein
MDFLARVKAFSREEDPKLCSCDHKLQGTGVFYQSVQLIQCATCKGWQSVRKPIK